MEALQIRSGRLHVPVRPPDGQSGDWTIDTFTVSPAASQMTMLRDGGRYVPEGEYRRLSYKGSVVMSNTPSEIRDHLPLCHEAHGHVLINGLGLGMCIEMILSNPDVDHITVVEIDADVIALTGPSYADEDRVTIVHADALTYQPPKGLRYGAVWNDIWPTISADNYEQMKFLHRRYGRRSDFVGSWARPLVESLIREDRYDRAWHAAFG